MIIELDVKKSRKNLPAGKNLGWKRLLPGQSRSPEHSFAFRHFFLKKRGVFHAHQFFADFDFGCLL
jgi:hypothetical protein